MERPVSSQSLSILRHLSSANICKINSCLSVKFIGPLIGSGWTCRVNFTCINSGCSWSFGLSQCFSFQAFKIGPIFTPFIRYSVTETLCSVVPYFYCRDGATSVFAIAWFIRNYEIRCGLVAKKSLKIHAYNKRHLIINGLQRGLWRRPAAGIRPARQIPGISCADVGVHTADWTLLNPIILSRHLSRQPCQYALHIYPGRP